MQTIFEKAKKQGRKILTELEAKEVLRSAGIPVVETVLAASLEEAQTLACRMGFPVALKACHTEIVHKTDVGGVLLNLANEAEVGHAYNQIIKNVIAKYPQLNNKTVTVQRMVHEGVELVLGMNRDPQFGPVIMFGLGGIFVEVLKDVSFRLIPLSEDNIREMISEIRGKALLEGVRGRQPVNQDALVDIIVKLARLVEDNPQISELDINPLFAGSKGAVAADARIIIE